MRVRLNQFTSPKKILHALIKEMHFFLFDEKSLDNSLDISDTAWIMVRLSTREAAKRLGINYDTLAHYIAVGKVAPPEIAQVGKRVIHMWTEAEIEHVRQLLPKIANGRKTRYSKLREKQKPQPGAAVPHKSRRTKKKVRTKPPKANG